jgi:hypothetical protein
MPAAQYKKEKLQISGNVIVSLIFIFFLCILFFPFLKCFLMNREEHLDSKDVVFAFFSFFIIASTLTVAVWNMYTYQALYRNGRDEQLYSLAKQINKSFGKEAKVAIDQLKLASMEFRDSTAYDQFIFRRELMKNYKSDTVLKTDTVLKKNHINDKYLYKTVNYPFTRHIVWIDSSGNQKIRWTTFKYSPAKINVSERPYFKKALENDLWKDTAGNSFYLDAIKSWLSNEVLGVISMQSENRIISRRVNRNTANEIPGASDTALPVMIISGKFQSVFNPVLPDGFGFAIINQEGKALFHSNLESDLYENFFRENDNNILLNSALKTRIAEFYTSYYYGSKFRFFVTPVSEMPLYVVSFSELGRLGEDNTSLLSSLSVFIFIQALLIFLSAILIQAFRVRFSSSGIKTYNLTWLTFNPKNRAVYISHIWLYGLMVLIEIFLSKPLYFWNSSEHDDTLFFPGIVLTYSILSVAFSYYLIRVKSEQTNNGKPSLDKNTMGGVTGLYLFVLVLFLINLGNQNIFLLLNFVALQALALLLFRNIDWIINKGNFVISKLINKIHTFSNQSIYIAALLMFIFLNGVVATTKIYKQAYFQETGLYLKAEQLNLAKSFWNKNDTIILDNDSLVGRYYKNIIADSVVFLGKKDSFPEVKDSKNDIGSFYRRTRPAYKEYARSLGSYSAVKSDDNRYVWEVKNDSLILFAGTNSTISADIGINRLKVSTTLKPLVLPGLNYYPGLNMKERFSSFVIVFYSLILLLLLGLYLLIREFLKRAMFPLVAKDETTNYEILKDILECSTTRHLMIVGLPDSGKTEVVKKILQPPKEANIITNNRVSSFDMTDPEMFESSFKTLETDLPYTEEDKPGEPINYVLVRNFEYCFTKKDITEKKLDFLERLLRKKKWRLILFSTTQALPFIDEYFDIIKNAPDKETEESMLKTVNARIAAERWTNVMNNFPVFYYRWEEEQRAVPDKDINQFVKSETSNSDFMYSLRQSMKILYEKKSRKEPNPYKIEDEMEMNISQVAANYFDSVWMSLTKTERKVLYDFAKDQLINFRNIHDISILYQKGLLRVDEDEMKLMNRGFRNYILNRLDTDELIELQETEAENGTWHKMRNVLIVVIILVGIFLFITQQESLNSLVAYLTAFSGGIAALLNIVNRMPGGSK